jgi:hypothetical protein
VFNRVTAPLLISFVASVGGFTAGLATTVIAFLAAMVVVWLCRILR